MKVIDMTPRLDSQRREHGFSIIQILIILALVSIITMFGAIGIVKARAQMRLNNSVRQFASWAEKARGDSIRRHAMGGERASISLNNTTSYTVTMDLDRDGVISAGEVKTYTLETGVLFTSATPVTITFDWRGRSITGEVTPVMALTNDASSSKLITVTGSGDVTIEAQIFQDAGIPTPTLNGNPSGDTRLDPTPNPTATPIPNAPTPTPTPTPNPDPQATPTPTPTPTPDPCSNNGGNNCKTPTPTPTPTPPPTPTPTPMPTPTPYPTTGPCTLSASPTTLSIGNKVTKSVTLSVNNATTVTTIAVTGNSNTPHISVSLAPGQSASVSNGSGSAVFNILVNGNNQGGTVTFTAVSGCGATASIRIN